MRFTESFRKIGRAHHAVLGALRYLTDYDADTIDDQMMRPGYITFYWSRGVLPCGGFWFDADGQLSPYSEDDLAHAVVRPELIANRFAQCGVHITDPCQDADPAKALWRAIATAGAELLRATAHEILAQLHGEFAKEKDNDQN